MTVERLPLSGTFGERSAAAGKDTLLKNCFKDTVRELDDAAGGENAGKVTTYVEKRPGLKSYDNLSAATTDTGRGIVNWEGRIYALIGDELFSDETDLGQVNTTSGRVHFDLGLDAEDGEISLVFHDGTTIYVVDDENNIAEFNNGGTGGATDIETLPTAMVPGIVVLDQYLCVMDSAGNIYNSTVGDVTAGYGNFVNLEMKHDKGVRIARYINYMIGFGEQTIEILYDAANTSGSPFNRFEGMGLLIGCASANTVANCDNRLPFVAQSPDGGRFVAMFDGGFKAERISTSALDKILDLESTGLANAYAFHVRHGGHSFYVLTLPTTAGRTFAYQFDEQEWVEWSSNVSTTESFFQAMDTAQLSGKLLMLDDSNGLIYQFDNATFQDQTGSNETIKVEVVTTRHDNNTMQNKFQSRAQVIGDYNASTGTITVEYTDDDYQTWSTARTQDLDNSESWLTRLGMFKRRAFRIKHEQNLRMRISHIETNTVTGHYGRG